MFRHGRVGAAMAFAAALPVCVLWPAARVAAEDDYSQTMMFSGRDVWRNGAFAYTGLLVAPGGFEQDGFMLKLLTSGGFYRYWAGSLGEHVIGAEWQIQATPGVRIQRGPTELKLFMGPEWQMHWLSPDDPGNKLRGQNFGLRFAAELWSEPTPNTLIAGDVSLGTLATGQSARLAYGWRVTGEFLNEDSFFVGPEVQAFGSDGYRQGRVGAHITTMKTEDIEWSAAIGYARDSDGRSSPYFRLGLSQKL